MQGSELLSASCTSSSESRASIEEGSASNRCDRGHRHDPCARCHHRSVRWKQVAAAGRARGGPIKIPAYGENTVSVCTAALLPLHAPTCHTYFGANLWPPVQIGKLMNKNVAEAARRVFGNLPHSKVRSGNKALRKNIIGRKIAEVGEWSVRVGNPDILEPSSNVSLLRPPEHASYRYCPLLVRYFEACLSRCTAVLLLPNCNSSSRLVLTRVQSISNVYLLEVPLSLVYVRYFINCSCRSLGLCNVA